MPPDTITLSGEPGTAHVFSTVAAQRGEVQTIDLKPAYTSLGLPVSAFKPEFRGSETGKVFDAAVGGGVLAPDIVWLFQGADYIRVNLRSKTVERLPTPIVAGWAPGAWPATFARHIDAAVTFTNWPDHAWFFRGGEYTRYNLRLDQHEGGPAPILGNWNGWPEAFASGVDATATGTGPAYEGMSWFFKGDQYWRFNNNINAVDVGPRPIAGNWPGWPERFTKVDCVISGVGSDSEQLYMICGDEFVTYDLVADKVISPPRQIVSRFPFLAPFLARPQLFLVDRMSLRTYYGDILAGDLQPETYTLAPESETTFSVVVKRSQTATETQTSTVLESQSAQLVDDLHTSMHDESASSSSNEKYDYQFDSSFDGELSYSGFGGSVDANLSFSGSSNDAREAASKAAGHAVSKQVQRAEQSRREASRVVSGSVSTTESTETSYTRTVRNTTQKAINLGVFRLVQQYIALVGLTDVRLAFSNGSESEEVPLRRIDDLLAKYVDDASQAAAIKTALLAELADVRDYDNNLVVATRDAGGGQIEFDARLETTFALKGPDGAPRRTLLAPGVLLHEQVFNQLTDAMLFTELSIEPVAQAATT